VAGKKRKTDEELAAVRSACHARFHARQKERRARMSTEELTALRQKLHLAGKTSRDRRLKALLGTGICCATRSCGQPVAGASRMCLYHWIYLCGHSHRAADAAGTMTRGQRAKALLEQWHEQGGRCAITGLLLTPGVNASVDHILPVARGGGNDIANLRFVHTAVNRLKLTMTDDELSLALMTLAQPLEAWWRWQLGRRIATGLARPGRPAPPLTSETQPVPIADVL
jgi:5-methylcytosine-specific restriction endonuclease McrA